MIEPLLPGGAVAYRWTCDLCGYHRASSPLEDTCLIQARHICPEDPLSENMKTVILICWEKLDVVMDELMPLAAQSKLDPLGPGHLTAEGWARLDQVKAKARGMAEIMAVWSAPHFRDADAIAHEAAARWQARQAGEERHTRGTVIALAGADARATYALERAGARPSGRRTTTASTFVPSKQFAPDEVVAIKNAATMGFPLEDIAKMFKCTEANIKKVLEAAS